jgi:hypothetical protein
MLTRPIVHPLNLVIALLRLLVPRSTPGMHFLLAESGAVALCIFEHKSSRQLPLQSSRLALNSFFSLSRFHFGQLGFARTWLTADFKRNHWKWHMKVQ